MCKERLSAELMRNGVEQSAKGHLTAERENETASDVHRTMSVSSVLKEEA